MTDYSNACIYKIVCKDTNVKEIYVGSTSNFKIRMRGHKSTYHNPNNPKNKIKVYQYIRANGGWDNWEMVKIKDVENCLNRDELCQVECDFYNSMGASLNTHVPKSNRKETLERHRNKPSSIKRQADWYQKNKEKIKIRGKERYDKNKEEMNKKNIERYHKNKDKINKRRREMRAKKKLILSS